MFFQRTNSKENCIKHVDERKHKKYTIMNSTNVRYASDDIMHGTNKITGQTTTKGNNIMLKNMILIV